MGRRKTQANGVLWVAAHEIAATPGNPFYQRLGELLDSRGFDRHVEETCRPYYAERMGRPSTPPGVYFRMLMIGYFEGIASERGICWRVADSRSLGAFLGFDVTRDTPDHVHLVNTRKRIPVEAHQEVFRFVLSIVAAEGLLKGKTLGMDATPLEANASKRAMVRKDTGEDYQAFLRRLAEESGVETPSREDLLKVDRARKGKKFSNRDWRHPFDPDARISKTKDGGFDMLHKLEAASDLDTGAVVAVTVQAADLGDTTTAPATLEAAGDNLEAVADSVEEEARKKMAPDDQLASELVTDKGYHSDAALKEYHAAGARTYVPELERRDGRVWKGKELERDLVYANRRRTRGARGKRLLKKRSEICERNFAHLLESGGMRRVFLRTHAKIIKRLMILACGFNLGLVMRKLFGMGTPRGMADAIRAVFAAIAPIRAAFGGFWAAARADRAEHSQFLLPAEADRAAAA